MSKEVEFKDQEELKTKLLDSLLNNFLNANNLKVDQVMLREVTKENGEILYDYVKKAEDTSE